MTKKNNLGYKELVAIAVGGMVGGGIFTILGISVSIVGFLSPFAIALGGLIALFAAYSYVVNPENPKNHPKTGTLEAIKVYNIDQET